MAMACGLDAAAAPALPPPVGSIGTLPDPRIGSRTYAQLGADADGWITTQVVLYPDGNVKIQNLDHGPSIDLAGATVGIENSGGTLM